jgi:hypothetical protein
MSQGIQYGKTKMNSQSWKVAIVGPTGVAVNTPAFGLLYSFPTREEAEEHAVCFCKSGVKLALCDEQSKNQQTELQQPV